MPKLIPSIINCKCPKCRQGDLFCNKSSYQYKGFFDMPKKCPKCGQDFQIEAGFYYGAMYMSYAFTIAIIVAVFVAMIVFDVFTIDRFLITDFIVLVLVIPYIFRLSRSSWISLMISYDPKAIGNYERKA